MAMSCLAIPTLFTTSHSSSTTTFSTLTLTATAAALSSSPPSSESYLSSSAANILTHTFLPTLVKLLHNTRVTSAHFWPGLTIFGCYRHVSDHLVPVLAAVIFILLNLGRTSDLAAIAGNIVWLAAVCYGFIVAAVDIRKTAEEMAPKLFVVLLDHSDVILDLRAQ